MTSSSSIRFLVLVLLSCTLHHFCCSATGSCGDDLFLIVKNSNGTMYLETPNGTEVILDGGLVPEDDSKPFIEFSDYNGTLQFGRTYCFMIDMGNTTSATLFGENFPDSPALSLPENPCGCAVDGPLFFTPEKCVHGNNKLFLNKVYLSSDATWNSIPMPLEESDCSGATSVFRTAALASIGMYYTAKFLFAFAD